MSIFKASINNFNFKININFGVFDTHNDFFAKIFWLIMALFATFNANAKKLYTLKKKYIIEAPYCTLYINEAIV